MKYIFITDFLTFIFLTSLSQLPLPSAKNISVEITVSQIFDLAPSFYFMTENGKLYAIFIQQYFLQCIT